MRGSGRRAHDARPRAPVAVEQPRTTLLSSFRLPDINRHLLNVPIVATDVGRIIANVHDKRLGAVAVATFPLASLEVIEQLTDHHGWHGYSSNLASCTNGVNHGPSLRLPSPI